MTRTDKAWVVGVGGLLAYEAYTLFNGTPGDTLSESMWEVSAKRPLVPLALGLVTGHFVVGARKTSVLGTAAFGVGFLSAALFWREAVE